MGLLVPPVLIIAFNRPDSTRRVFSAVRAAKPSKLFLACDAARPGKAGEAARVAEVRALVDAVDWPCEVRTKFPESNLGCGLGVSTAITWFLGEAGEGIILEDDCLPAPAFFRFCAVMLGRYRDDVRIGLVSGAKMAPSVDLGHPYGFSRIFACWGWATWRRAWEGCQLHPPPIAFGEGWQSNLHRRTVRKLTQAIAEQAAAPAHSWAYPCMLHMLRKDMLTVVPNHNLVLNIGFDGSGAHFAGNSRPWWVPRQSFDTGDTWGEAPPVRASAEFDRYFQATAHGGSSKLFRGWLKWKRRIRTFFRPDEA
jgi:hypothetical protein